MKAPIAAEIRPNGELLDELRARVANRPRYRMHVHPESAMWIAIGVQNTGLSEHVQVVADPACPEKGRGWVEVLTMEQWRDLRALVGKRVSMSTPDLGQLAGVLLKLDHDEAQIDLGSGDVRYTPWLTIKALPDLPTTYRPAVVVDPP